MDDMTLVCERCGKTIADVPDVRIEGECCHLWREGSRLKAKVWQAVNEKESDSNESPARRYDNRYDKGSDSEGNERVLRSR